jgi:hypothetical protein
MRPLRARRRGLSLAFPRTLNLAQGPPQLIQFPLVLDLLPFGQFKRFEQFVQFLHHLFQGFRDAIDILNRFANGG